MATRKVLLAENHDSEQTGLLAKMFQDSGFQVTLADNGRKAVEEVARTAYDLVMTDLDLHQIDGIGLLRRVKRINEAMPVILVSEKPGVKEAVEAMKLGAADFLLKPLTQKMIEGIIAGVSNGSNSEHKVRQNAEFKIVTGNLKMKQLLQIAKDVADSRASIFIQGESGTGKELFARFVHNCSSRRNKKFVAINCAALPETLLESELFGHEKGAFTGAITRKKGKFEIADNGTLLLDEISEMDYQLQSKLLRVLQEREIDRIGGISPVPVDVRFIATTNRNIEEQIKERKFREDLFYRLNVVPFHLPPLRERTDDIPLLADYFVAKYCKIDNRSVKGLTEEALTTLMQMPWKGNIREFENVIERAILMCKADFIEKETLFLIENYQVNDVSDHSFIPSLSLKEVEKNVIFRALDQTNGNRTHAADVLGISVRTLRNKLNEYRKSMEA